MFKQNKFLCLSIWLHCTMLRRVSVLFSGAVNSLDYVARKVRLIFHTKNVLRLWYSPQCSGDTCCFHLPLSTMKMESTCPSETLVTSSEMTVCRNYVRTKSSFCRSCGRVRCYLLFCWHSCRSCAPVILIVHSAVCWRCVAAPHHSSAPFSWIVGREGCHLNRITHRWEHRGGTGRTVLKDVQLVSSTRCSVVCSVSEIEGFQPFAKMW